MDNGGFFPEQDDYEDDAWFLMDAMKVLGTDAVGMSEKELRYGRGFLLANYKRTKLPLVCANMIDNVTKKPLVAPYLVKKIGSVNVGIFGLASDKADLGPARDSITIEDPIAAGRRTIRELHAKGATVVVLLSQLGKIESEDYVTAVDSVDVVICGRNVPLLQKGKMINKTIACYGGEQGQYVGETVVTLDAARHMKSGDCETSLLSPEVGEKPEVLALVKAFEDNFNDKLRKKEKEKAAQAEANRIAGNTQGNTEQAVDHYLGAEFCQRCHKLEYDQWKSTKHAQAWQTLVDVKKDATPECITCHVVGYKQTGGFQTGDDAARMGNVQCEMCHGMGTQHDAFPAQARRITSATCEKCHTASNSPTFDFAIYEPHILHHPPATMPPLPKNPMDSKMMQGSAK